MKTTRWLATLFIALLATHAASGAVRPNFLFLYTDDQRWDALSVVQKEQGERGRFPWFQTPNMDRVAAEGVRFRNAFVTLSLCAPSRACFLTGRYNHFNGIASNFRPFPADNVTHATLLRAAGYTTAYIGKWHMDSQRERPGFDFHASFIGHARYVDPPFIVDGTNVATKGWIDDISTDYAIDFMRRQKGTGRPWSMVVGYKAPHGPFDPPARLKDKFAGENARAVPNLDSPAPYREAPGAAPKLNADGTVPVNLNYFRCIAGVDENVGRLLKTLEELGIADDTVIIYTSDNGFYLGEHRLGDKRSAYDESLRIPFLVRYPRLGVKGRLVDEMVLNIDLAPTLLDFAGVAAPKEMQGRSWRSLLTGPAADWRRSFFYEYFWERQKGSPPTHTAVRTVTAKLIKYPGHDEWTELFNLAADPYETKNLFNDPASAALRRELEAEYEKQRQAVGYVVPAYAEDARKHPDVVALNGPVLDFRFDKDVDAKVIDASGRNHHGTSRGAPLVDGKNGKARRFDGGTHLDLPKFDTLNPAAASWRIEVTMEAAKADGVVLAHGGASNGYALALRDGKPVLVVVGAAERASIASERAVTGGRVTVTAGWKAGTMFISVNGEPAREAPLKNPITKLPNDVMQLGADLGSQVMATNPGGFSGLIERVRIVSGEGK
jgi:arylsulfatase A-like enzyme